MTREVIERAEVLEGEWSSSTLGRLGSPTIRKRRLTYEVRIELERRGISKHYHVVADSEPLTGNQRVRLGYDREPLGALGAARDRAGRLAAIIVGAFGFDWRRLRKKCIGVLDFVANRPYN